MDAFVSYLRVSTTRQGDIGLGFEAQRRAAARHVAGGRLLAEYLEIENGRKNDRPHLLAALPHAQATGATLVIAKLDRLARNVHFVSGLMEAGVNFVACDNPHSTKLTIQVLAAIAEHEREMIASRTKAALGVVNAAIAANGSWTSRRSGRRITRLGNPNGARALCTAAKGNTASLAAIQASGAAWRGPGSADHHGCSGERDHSTCRDRRGAHASQRADPVR